MARQRIAILQVLRGVAASLVVLWHFSIFLGPYGEGIGGALFEPGATMGVDLFFLISGFIMVYTTYDDEPRDAGIFLLKRLLRIWPVYAVATVIEALKEQPEIQKFVLSLLFIPTGGGFAPVYGWPVVGVGWTLNYEMYFYLVFGLTMLLGRLRWLAFFAWCVATLLVIPWVLTGTVYIQANTPVFFGIAYLNLMTNPIIWLFAAGAAVGLLYRSAVRITVGASRIFLAAALVFAVGQYAAHWRIDTHGILAAGLSPFILMLAVVLALKVSDIPAPRPLVYLGEISYSLYLLHPFVLGVVAQPWFPGTPSLRIVAGCCLSVAVASLSHRWFERLGPRAISAIRRHRVRGRTTPEAAASS